MSTVLSKKQQEQLRENCCLDEGLVDRNEINRLRELVNRFSCDHQVAFFLPGFGEKEKEFLNKFCNDIAKLFWHIDMLEAFIVQETPEDD